LLIQTCDLSLLPELRQHFERSGFRVEQVGETLDVGCLDTSDEENAARELRTHLRVCFVLRPGVIEHATG